jgi:hypothetical protein
LKAKLYLKKPTELQSEIMNNGVDKQEKLGQLIGGVMDGHDGELASIPKASGMLTIDDDVLK